MSCLGGSPPEGCDPTRIFELAEGSLRPEEAREVRSHLEGCAGCRELHERERGLNACLGSLSFSEEVWVRSGAHATHKSVAMALPTRCRVARAVWALLAGALLVSVAAVPEWDGLVGAVVLALGALAALWGLATVGADVIRAVLAAAGSTVLLVLVLGALVDLLVAAAVLLARRHAKSGTVRHRAREI